MKKYISVLVAAVMASSIICACGNGNAQDASAAGTSAGNASEAVSEVAGDSDISIVTTIFPEYDWVKNIAGENPANADITMLLDSGVDLHSYQPTAEDIAKISKCDMFIYVGGESDEWVDDALKEATNKDMVVINLLDVLGDDIKEEEVVEGMEAEEEEAEEGEEGEEVEYDEHVWLSLKNAAKLCSAIKDGMVSVDEANKDVYEKNANDYITKLEALDAEYENVVKAGSKKTVLFADRFPFRYLVDDYGLEYYAAFVGCSAETEASFETITFLSKKVDELGLGSILTIEGKDKKIADTVKQNTAKKDQNILTMDSLQSTTSDDVAKGVTYISVMEGNLEVLKEALK
ncbi:metal ABC transporter substrate-binding protein [Butyrivibrio sp. M55]|uniref:metal ABC transporter substrate-binding protein n=1 Tax=Butyrivibrio sp. M55 TaxID=1855323 RepID=UPI0008EC91C6|nr:metal ABC transporter substrate-binding protein [Butyrivibrio sp. M55]SFU50671.1 zinc transport system substrate-binding protein [Butyrivibrio sp. M55]